MGGFGKLDWSNLLYGLTCAVVSGGATSVTTAFSTALVAPEQFNLEHPGKMFAVMSLSFATAGALAGFGFLKQNPLPKEITITSVTVEKTVVQSSKGGSEITKE